MYGVRVIVDDDRTEVRVFETLAGARQLFDACQLKTLEGEYDSLAIFNVPDAEGVREAAQAIRDGNKNRIELVDFAESQDRTIAKLLPKLRIEI